MKKQFAIIAAVILLFSSCQKSANHEAEVNDESTAAIETRYCATYEVLQEQLKADPTLADRMDKIEQFTKKFMENPSVYRLVNGVMEVPVVVNVLYRSSLENISDAQVQSQIDVLNNDFSGTNTDVSRTPSEFSSVLSGDTKIHFTLQKINRKATNKKSWTTNDAMKKSSQGGIDPTSPSTTLNMWSCNLGNGLLGYAQFPGGNPATDGVVILYSAFGSRSIYPAGTYISKYDLGRTATHEVGHYFNLRHIWGDTNCGNDYVGDTPLHNSANYGCPPIPSTSNCGGTHDMMTMNYMDYTDDACMYMFTAGQGVRMQATYAEGGPRASMR
jgi:hypothetical protein